MLTKISNQDIEEYYNQTQFLYDFLYSQGTGGLHYGFWRKNTKNTREAILNTNKFILENLEINEQDTILDAGCGIGATSIFVAENSKAKVFGITLSKTQLKKAKKPASKSKKPERLDFSIQDFNRTKFEDETFSKIFGIESICYANEKLEFLRESHRLLKKNGKIAVIDFFLRRKDFNNEEKENYVKVLNGWRLPDFSLVENFRSDLEKAGFSNIQYYDKFDEIKKTRDRIWRLGILGYPFSWLALKLGIFSQKIHHHTLTCIAQKKFLSDSNSIGTYGVFIAEK